MFSSPRWNFYKNVYLSFQKVKIICNLFENPKGYSTFIDYVKHQSLCPKVIQLFMDYVEHWSLRAYAAMRGLTTFQKGKAGAYKRSLNPSNSKLVTIKYLFEREREREE